MRLSAGRRRSCNEVPMAPGCAGGWRRIAGTAQVPEARLRKLAGFDLGAARASRCCIPSGDASSACSAIVQQLVRGSPASKPNRNDLTRLRGSSRANRDAIRPNSSSKPRRDRSGSSLWHAVTAISSVVHATPDHQTWPRYARDHHAARSRTTAGVTRADSGTISRRIEHYYSARPASPRAD